MIANVAVREFVMLVRVVVVLTSLAMSLPAASGELRPDEAKHFVAGKLFAYTCFEGTSGVGRIHPDGSVAGTIRIRGAGQQHYVALPAGTIRVNPEAVCASVRGAPFQPCFNLEQTSHASFRGSVSGLGFAYCDFVRINPRTRFANSPMRIRPIRPAAPVTAPVEPVMTEPLRPTIADAGIGE